MIFPLVGNTKIADTVLNFIRQQHIPHAILIEGDSGTGKHTLARFICKAVVMSGENNDFSQEKPLSEMHADITVIAPEQNKKNISVSQIRNLREEAYIKPHSAPKRVFVIDFADTMNEQSQNALLKVLEEPPETTVFILLTESKAPLLETVLSRCVLLTLSPPKKNDGVEYIMSNTKFEESDIEYALEISRNNIGEALKVLEGKDTKKTQASAKEFLEYYLRNDTFGILSVTAQYDKNRIEAQQFLKDLKSFTVSYLRKKLKSFEAVKLSKLYDTICELEKSLITNINLSLLFCSLISRSDRILNDK